ncbi:MAG: 2-oxoacid ferredoxin oxidoreductase, partial [Thermoplasmata archaeon]
HEWGDRIPIGLFYQTDKPTYEEEEPALKKGPLVKQPLGLSQEQGEALIHEFR